jgi:transposase
LLRGRDVQELKELQRQGMSIQAISELTGWDRKTIRKYVQRRGSAPEYGPELRSRASWMRSSRIGGAAARGSMERAGAAARTARA